MSSDSDADGIKPSGDLRSQANTATSLSERIDDLHRFESNIAVHQSRVIEQHERAAEGLRAIEALRSEAEVALKQIAEDTRKAHSESGFAFNAKGNAEEHAKVVAQIRGTVEATFSGLTATKQKTDALGDSLEATRNQAEAAAKSIENARKVSSQIAAEVTAAGERVAAIIPSIEAGGKEAHAITAAKSGAEAGATAIQLLQNQIAETSAKSASDAASIAKSEAECKDLLAAMSAAQKTAADANDRLAVYEQEIATMKVAYKGMQDKLEGLLPHATSAGLASAFHNQKERFRSPQRWWLGLFLVAIVLLLGAACWDISNAGGTWDSILRHFANRLPIVAPLVWVAIYAGHHHNMTIRMEEDYAYKEAVSTAFEGYKREMLAIPNSPGSEISPLVQLCENVLRAVAERPGRIYDGKSEVMTPLTPFLSTLKEMAAEFSKRKGEKS